MRANKRKATAARMQLQNRMPALREQSLRDGAWHCCRCDQ
jgi:hypothetical protein